MNSLTELYNNALVPLDAELEKQAAAELEQYAAEEAEMLKEAEEQDAAGRIMARGFADELDKLAAGMPAFIQQKMDEKKKAEGEKEDEDEDDKEKAKAKAMEKDSGDARYVQGKKPPETGVGVKFTDIASKYNKTIPAKKK